MSSSSSPLLLLEELLNALALERFEAGVVFAEVVALVGVLKLPLPLVEPELFLDSRLIFW